MDAFWQLFHKRLGSLKKGNRLMFQKRHKSGKVHCFTKIGSFIRIYKLLFVCPLYPVETAVENIGLIGQNGFCRHFFIASDVVLPAVSLGYPR